MESSEEKEYSYIYGPVPSWRLGSSLGIDPISSDKKYCSFKCIYCQLFQGKTALTGQRKIFIDSRDMMEELKRAPDVPIDYLTFSGTGEPTLAKNLGELIRAAKSLSIAKTAVITNSSLMHLEEVRTDLIEADTVVAKLDAPSEEMLRKINRPFPSIGFDKIIEGLSRFRDEYKGKLAIQIMFVDRNIGEAEAIAEICRQLQPDEVQLNTPLRPCPVAPLSAELIAGAAKYFHGLNVITVYNTEKKEVQAISGKDTLRRRGKYL
ncbi:MAG: radical SAM protein [Brevinematales bacterium]|nr:radical SAM protein [Brevinematales bacterium]